MRVLTQQFILCMFILGCGAAASAFDNVQDAATVHGTNSMQENDVTPNEHDEIDVVIAQLFNAISFEENTAPSMSDIKPLFVQRGLLTNFNEETPLTLPVSDFIQYFENQVARGEIPSLEDREVYQHTEIHGRIAHRTSFYEARFKSNDLQPFAVGVNSIQLIKTSEGWRIVSMTWNDDNRGIGFFNATMSTVSHNE